ADQSAGMEGKPQGSPTRIRPVSGSAAARAARACDSAILVRSPAGRTSAGRLRGEGDCSPRQEEKTRRERGLINVRFAPKATEVLRCREALCQKAIFLPFHITARLS